MKKSIIVSLVLSCISLAVYAEKPSADEVLKSTNDALNKLSNISYDSYREINNFKDNYFSKSQGSVYFEFDNNLEGKVSRFQLKSELMLQIYNGTEYFLLDDQTHAYETTKIGVKKLANLSLLYNSMATLRVSFSLIQPDKSIPKTIKDTIVDGKTYHLLTFELYKKSIGFPSGYNTFDTDVTRYYKVIIDQKTYLPYMIFDSNSISKDQYYTKTIFTNINTHPLKPGVKTWYSSSYKGYTLKKQTTQKPLPTVGSLLLKWKLPQYSPLKIDTINSTQSLGKIVVMEFWIKNCGYCMEALPEIKQMQEKYGQKVEILSINAYEKKEEIDFFYKREKPNYKMLYDGEKLANSLGIYAYPATIILDKTGTVAYVSSGFDRGKTELIIDGLLNLK